MSITSQSATTDWSASRVITEYWRKQSHRSGGFEPSKLIQFTKILKNVGAGANLYVAAGDAFAAIVHVLESTGRFKIVSRPTIFTSNNKKAIIASGQEVPVPVSTLSNVAQNNIINNNTAAVQSSIEYKKVVLQLEVVPLINSEKEVSLDILQKVDSLVPNGAVNISGNQVPTIDTKYIHPTFLLRTDRPLSWVD